MDKSFRTVYVVMGNDFPDAVFSTNELAEEYINKKRAEEGSSPPYRRRIYWRVYPFVTNEKALGT